MSNKKMTAMLGGIMASLMLMSSTSCGLIIVNDISAETSAHEHENKEAENTSSGKAEQDWVKYENKVDGLELSKEYLADLPKRDYEGAVFFVTTPNAHYISPADTSTAVSRLAVERNAMVEDMFNISLIVSLESSDKMLDEMKKAAAADSYYTDLAMIPIYLIGQFRKDETLINLRTLPFFDLQRPYFNSESSDMTSGGYMTYGVAGEASISPSSFSAVLMNKDVLSEAGIDPYSLYDFVESGEWTWDVLLRCTEAVTSLNESGNADGEYYTLTVQSAADRLPDLMFKSCGWDFVRTGTRITPAIGYRPTALRDTFDVISSVYNDPKAILDGSAGAVACFDKGESAFLVEYLNIMPDLAESSTDWGLLPLPKRNENGNHKTLISNNELVFGVPVNHTNGEYAAIILSALNAASCGYIYDEYVEYNMFNVLRDNDSVNMLDLILDTASFDFALAFGSAYPEIAEATYRLVRECAASNDLADKYAERAERANDLMKEEFYFEP